MVLGGCTFLIIGQAQVGDVFSRDDLSEAMALFALSRTFAVMVGPLGGGLLCELIGWRSTFWACAIIDALLFVISFVYIPETITTLPEDRKKLTFCLPFRPLVELKYRSVGMLCLVNGAVWGMLYLFFITYPMVFSMMTDNEFMIGVYMLPGICGTLVGAKIAGKLGRPKTAPEKLTEKKKCCDWKSFWRTWFPWSVCGRCCSCLAAENINSKTDVRFLGFPVPALGEWCSVAIGVLMAIGGSSVVGWALTLACDDGMLLPSLSDATGAIDAANTAVSANSSAGVMTRLPPAIYDPFDIDQMVYRLDNKLYCKEFNWWAIIIYWCLMFVLCAGAMMIVVGTSTYLSQARPASRSSVAASQRSAQMLVAAITMSVGGVLFDVIGPGWTHSIVTMAGAPLAIFGLCCVPRNPEGTRAFKEAEQEAKEKEKAAAKKVDGGRP